MVDSNVEPKLCYDCGQEIGMLDDWEDRWTFYCIRCEGTKRVFRIQKHGGT